eukprot:COSAG02_NODE_857_length_16462_cov_4.801381_8_plen_70_part_00
MNPSGKKKSQLGWEMSPHQPHPPGVERKTALCSAALTHDTVVLVLRADLKGFEPELLGQLYAAEYILST